MFSRLHITFAGITNYNPRVVILRANILREKNKNYMYGAYTKGQFCTPSHSVHYLS